MSQMSRRSVLAGGLALTTLPLSTLPLHRAYANPSDPDVVIIGAGSAGLAAARTLIGQGKTVVIVEAADRIGGRAYTESETFGIPFDHGCSWITADPNPYAGLARDWGYELLDHASPGEAFFVEGKRANSKQRKKYDQAWSAIQGALNKSGREGLDVAAASVIPKDLEYSAICQSWIGAMDWGVDFKNLSTQDNWQSAEASPNLMVKQGHGTLVARLGEGLPVRLNTPATRIDWSGEGVAVATPAGTIRAKACIVTVSTGVLAAEKIRFDPVLPDWKRTAIDNLPMGLLAKVALQFDGERFGLTSNNWLTYWVPDEVPAKASYFLTWPFEFNVAIGFVGGEFGWQLSAAGKDAAVDFVLGEFVRIVGSDARKHFVRGHLTDWAENPLTLGAYAAARPGHHDAREDLARPLADRIFFAGEAVAGAHITLCGGAYMSGEKVAMEVARAVS